MALNTCAFGDGASDTLLLDARPQALRFLEPIFVTVNHLTLSLN